MVKLVISDNEGTTTVVPLVRDEITIGRKDGNTIRLTERNVSRTHARLHQANGGYHLTDLDSYNGVIINGQLIQGEVPVQPGDQIMIGDYSLAVEQEGEVASAPVFEDAKTQVAPMPRPQLPARLVMLGAPSPGAEFSLSDSDAQRMGRSEEADIPINHRSVSREHAEVSGAGGAYTISDLASANGITVNGEQTRSHELKSGDVVELGQVLLRFVAPDEHYLYDPADALLYQSPHSGLSRNNLIAAAAIVGVSIVAAALIVSSGEESAPAQVTPLQPATADPGVQEVPLEEAPAQVDPAQAHAKALADCRAALGGGRFAEAMAHAGLALQADAASEGAADCRKQAETAHEEEQIFVRGTSALQNGDPEAAYREFARLGDESPYRGRPEIGQSIEQVGRARVTQGRKLLGRNRPEAMRLASSVLSFPGMPAPVQTDARALQQEIRKANAAAPAPRPVAVRSPRSASPKPVAAAPGQSPMQVAGACLARGDNACVIRALKGKARSAQELGLLIETYRAMGNSVQAKRYMATYVKRYPTARRASAYRKMLERAP